MPQTRVRPKYTCAYRLRALHERHVPSIHWECCQIPPLGSQRVLASKLTGPSVISAQRPARNTSPTNDKYRLDNEPELGAMSRRLAQATDDALLEGGRAGRKAIEEAGFSEELKQRLLEKVEAQLFRSENASAIAEAGLGPGVGRGTRDIAAAQTWSGTESTEDTVLRMLHDAHKSLNPRLRTSNRINIPVMDMRVTGDLKQSSAQKLANARDKTNIYSSSRDSQLSESEREAMRKELKERFTPGARAMPSSIRGLAALANERIEDAIARGQFKNIPRGKAVERDARADNPFLDTTEYIMNKMIQRQHIVPPWIEKQQELVKAANIFRGRLRNDWRRHVVRSISSRGGSLKDQVKTADLYAKAEGLHNPQILAVEQITLPISLTNDSVMTAITRVVTPASQSRSPNAQTTIGQEARISTAKLHQVPITTSEKRTGQGDRANTRPHHTSTSDRSLLPFRDPVWEKAQLSYHTLAISNLNNLTRSYNLMAPDLAKKPYFSLERELRSCYADVAPELAQAIQDCAARPLVEKVGHKTGGILERLGGELARVNDSKQPLYGFREFWADLFGAKRR